MQKGYPQPRQLLSLRQRTKVFDAVAAKVAEDYFDPKFNGVDWNSLTSEARGRICGLGDPEEFESAVHTLVRSLGTSHTGFFHKSVKRVPARLAIGATFGRITLEDSCFWIAQDVHPGGPAELAGMRQGDVLLSVNGVPKLPPEPLMFAMGVDASVVMRRADREVSFPIAVPAPQSRKQPHANTEAVSWRIVQPQVGYLKVAILPGLLGLNVAREIDQAIAMFEECEAMVLDLRGHLGGGLGVLRLMSCLVPDKRPIGYTVTRKKAQLGYDKTKLPVLGRLPTHLPNALAIAKMGARFLGRDPSVLLFSEGMSRRQWHQRIAVIVNEHTVSAGEMTAAFAAENDLAKIVGSETAGRLIPGSGYDVGFDYRLVMPNAEYVTWKGNRYEGRGVRPHVAVPWTPDTPSGEDPQLAAALEEVTR